MLLLKAISKPIPDTQYDPVYVLKDSEVADGMLRKKNISAFAGGRGEVAHIALVKIPRIHACRLSRPPVGTLARLASLPGSPARATRRPKQPKHDEVYCKMPAALMPQTQ